MSDAAQAAATPAIMRVDHVSVSFGDTKILDDLSFSMEEGNFTCICGPSGCGKTTIMSVLAGQPVSGPSPDRLVVFQENTLFQWMTLWDNTLFGPRIQGKNLKEAGEKARELIHLTGLDGFEGKFPGQLSGGMQRRAELIRALLITSELDEAVFMGDVLYLLSTMPTAIKKEMRVDLPRPRLVEHQTCPEFAEIQGEAFEVLESEALKSFEHVPGGR